MGGFFMLEQLTKEDLPDGVMDIVDTIGIDAFKGLVRLAGGSNLYIPNESSLVKSYRNKKLGKSLKWIIRLFLESLALARFRLGILLI